MASCRNRWIQLLVAVSLGLGVLPAHSQRTVQRHDAGEMARKAMREYNFMAGQFAGALPVKPGDTVVLFGMSTPNYLSEFLGRVGPDGRVFAVFRMESNYRYELEAGVSPEDARVEPVFAADGDAHIEPGVADLVVAMDLFGFYRREDALYRQAHRLLKPGGLLIQVRAVRRTEAEYLALHGSNEEPEGRRLAHEKNRQLLGVAQHGFEYVEEIPLFETRTIRVFRNRKDVPAAG